MDKVQELVERLMNILNISFLREPTRRLLNEISNEIVIRSAGIISQFMESLSISDLDMSLDFVVDPETDTDTILENIVDQLQSTIPYTLASVRNIPRLNTQQGAKHILAKLWYKRFVSKKPMLVVVLFICHEN